MDLPCLDDHPKIISSSRSWHASTNDALFTWLDDQPMIIPSSWTWYINSWCILYFKLFTSISSTHDDNPLHEHHQHMMISFIPSLDMHQHMMHPLRQGLYLMTINLWRHAKSSSLWNITYFTNSWKMLVHMMIVINYQNTPLTHNGGSRFFSGGDTR